MCPVPCFWGRVLAGLRSVRVSRLGLVADSNGWVGHRLAVSLVAFASSIVSGNDLSSGNQKTKAETLGHLPIHLGRTGTIRIPQEMDITGGYFLTGTRCQNDKSDTGNRVRV